MASAGCWEQYLKAPPSHSSLTPTFMISPSFNSSDADLVLRSAPSPHTVDFHVHRCTLSAASPFFDLMFTLPQASDDATTPRPVVEVAEEAETLECLLRFIYPTTSPRIHSYDQFALVFNAADKYDVPVAIDALRKILVQPQFLKDRPIWVYALASRFDLEEEAKLASRHTFDINLHDSFSCEDIKYVPDNSCHRLVDLHQRRSRRACDLLQIPEHIKCILCNGTYYGILDPPKWWRNFEERARKELLARPSLDVIFSERFLSESTTVDCKYCAASMSNARGFLDSLKKEIDDDIPATI